MPDKRLIDANAFLSAWHDWLHDDSDKRLFTHLIEDAPTIDAVEVVRCRVCIHRVRTNSTLGFSWCGKFGNVMRDADFCSWGERKMDGGAE